MEELLQLLEDLKKQKMELQQSLGEKENELRDALREGSTREIKVKHLEREIENLNQRNQKLSEECTELERKTLEKDAEIKNFRTRLTDADNKLQLVREREM